MKKLLAPLFFVLAVLAFNGCSSQMVTSTAGLHVDLVKLQRAADGEIHVTWRVRNPNVVAYVLTEVSLRASLNGAPVGTISDKSRFGVPPLNEVERSSVLTPNGPAAGEIIARAVAQGSAGYALDATLWMLLLDDKIEKFKLSSSGTIAATVK